MCRSHNQPCGARRCKTTEQERIAKANYRARAKLVKEYSSSLSSTPSAPPQKEEIVLPVDTREEKISELLKIIEEPQGDRQSSEYDLQLSAAYIQLGKLIAENMQEAEDKLEAVISKEAAKKQELEDNLKSAQSEMQRLRELETEITEDVYATTGINRQTYPIISERHEALQKDFPDQWQRIVDAEKAAEAAGTKYRDAIRQRNHESIMNSVDGGSEEWRAALHERREAYVKAMEEFGVSLNPNLKAEAAEKSNSRALKSLNNVMQYFPESWVNSSNEHHNKLIVKFTKGRAHYSTIASQRVNAPKYSSERKPSDWRPEPGDRAYDNAVRLTDSDRNPDGTYKYLDEVSGRTYRVRPPAAGEAVWMVPSYKHYEKRGRDGTISYEPAKKEGWESYEFDGYDYSVSPPQHRIHTRWRKMETRSIISNNVDPSSAMSELTVSGDNDSEMNRVASHEFCHRAEHVVPGVAKAEKAFLAYRSKQHTDNPDKLEQIRSGEIGYKDSFATHYAGRVYDGRSFEVLSVGMEMLLYGSNGGFQGRGDFRKDTEHRNFVLGLIASTRKQAKADN